jgi:hypothetical protein
MVGLARAARVGRSSSHQRLTLGAAFTTTCPTSEVHWIVSLRALDV